MIDDECIKTIHIDFAGQSGVGKTTIAKEVVNLLKKDKVRCVDLVNVSPNPIGNIVPLFKALLFCISLGAASLRIFKECFRYIGVIEMINNDKKKGTGIVVSDAGPFRRALTISRLCNLREVEFLEKYFQHRKKPDILIYLTSSPELVFRRKLSRNRKNEDVASFSDVSKEHYAYEERFGEIIRFYRNDIKILEFSNLEHPTLISRKIVNSIETYISE